jgi:hypothetical protein
MLMRMKIRRDNSVVRWALAYLLLLSGIASATAVAQTLPLPTSIADTTFWRMSSSFSEPGGDFLSDNFTSNETQFPRLVVDLLAWPHKGGAYLGVGPEQNFHYIVALKPSIVFQFDIRRQAVMQHLMYKAIFELSEDRAAFISLLFCKPRPAGLSATASITDIWDAYWFIPTDTAAFKPNFEKITSHLTRTHGFTLDASDIASLRYVYEAFYAIGPNISYSGYGNQPMGGLTGPATFAGLTVATDPAGIPRSFLATDESFRFLKDLHRRNLIIPVVGDFAGPKAIRAVGAYLAEHGTKVNAFYVSNVEQYLHQNGVAQQFYANVAALPLDSLSFFIRPGGVWFCPMKAFTANAAVGRVPTYAAANQC